MWHFLVYNFEYHVSIAVGNFQKKTKGDVLILVTANNHFMIYPNTILYTFWSIGLNLKTQNLVLRDIFQCIESIPNVNSTWIMNILLNYHWLISKISTKLKYCQKSVWFFRYRVAFYWSMSKTCSLNKSGGVFGGLFGLFALTQLYRKIEFERADIESNPKRWHRAALSKSQKMTQILTLSQDLSQDRLTVSLLVSRSSQ